MGERLHVPVRRLERFLHDRVIFVGDAAHQVSPFGARGANSGIQDADNLCWKLARVVRNESPASLLQSYDDERVEAADENILNSSRSTDFITPKSSCQPKDARRRARAFAAAPVRAPAGQQRPSVDAHRASCRYLVDS